MSNNNNLKGLNNDNDSNIRNTAGNIEFNLKDSDPKKSTLNIAPIVPKFSLEQFINAVNTRFAYFKFPVVPLGTRSIKPVNFDVNLIDFSSALPNIIDRKLKLASGQSITVRVIDKGFNRSLDDANDANDFTYTKITKLVNEQNAEQEDGSTYTINESLLSYLDSLNGLLTVKDEINTIKFKVSVKYKPTADKSVPNSSEFYQNTTTSPTINTSAFLLRLSLDTAQTSVFGAKQSTNNYISPMLSFALIDKKPDKDSYQRQLGGSRPDAQYILYKNIIDDIEKEVYSDPELYFYYTKMHFGMLERYVIGRKETEENYNNWFGRGIWDHYKGGDPDKDLWGTNSTKAYNLYKSEMSRVFDIDEIGRVRYVNKNQAYNLGFGVALNNHQHELANYLKKAYKNDYDYTGALADGVSDWANNDTRKKNPNLKDDELKKIIRAGIGNRLVGNIKIGDSARNINTDQLLSVTKQFVARYNNLVATELRRRFNNFSKFIVDNNIISDKKQIDLKGCEHYGNMFYPGYVDTSDNSGNSTNKDRIIEYFKLKRGDSTTYNMPILASIIRDFSDNMQTGDLNPQFFTDLSDFNSINDEEKTLQFEYIVPPALMYSIKQSNIKNKTLPFTLHAAATRPCDITSVDWQISVVKCPVVDSTRDVSPSNINKFKFDVPNIMNDNPYYYGSYPLYGLNNDSELAKDWLPQPNIPDQYTGLLSVSENTQLLISADTSKNAPNELPIGNYINNKFIPRTISLNNDKLTANPRGSLQPSQYSILNDTYSSWTPKYYNMIMFSDYYASINNLKYKYLNAQ